MKYEKQNFSDQRLVIDGNQYFGCTFERCTLVYCAEKKTELDTCSFYDCQFGFDGAAANTVDFMRVLYHGGFQSLIEATFNDIRLNQVPALPPVH